MINFERVNRTLIQSAAGAGVAFVTALMNDFSKQAIISAAITSISTVIIAVLMNIQRQVETEEEN